MGSQGVRMEYTGGDACDGGISRSTVIDVRAAGDACVCRSRADV
jgi:hypothetical protein